MATRVEWMMVRNTFRAFLLGVLLLPTVIPFAAEDHGHGFMFEPRLSGPFDLQVGARAGYLHRSRGGSELAAFLDGEMRAIAKVVHPGPGNRRYWEERASWGPGISAGFPLIGNWNAFAALGTGYSNAFYWFEEGEHPSSGWRTWGEVGLRRKMTDGQYWGFGLQRRELPEVFPWRIVLQYGYILGPGFSL